MRVRVTAACKVAYQGQILDLAEGEVQHGELAEYLSSTGAPVQEVDDEPGGPDGAANPPDPNEVPDAGWETVLAWAGDDPDKAARALSTEQAKKTPRVKLVAALEKLTAS